MAHDWTLTSRETINATNDATTYDTSGAWAPTVGHTYLFYVLNSKATTPDDASSVQHDPTGTPKSFTAVGTNLTFDTIASPLKKGRGWTWTADVTTSAVTRVTFGGTQTGCRAIVLDLGEEATYVTETKNNADASTSVAATPAALGSTDNVQIAFGCHDLNNQGDVVSGTDWTSSGNGLANSNPNMTLELAFNESGVAQQATFSTAGSADRGIHIFEFALVAVGQPAGRRYRQAFTRNFLHGVEGMRIV